MLYLCVCICLCAQFENHNLESWNADAFYLNTISGCNPLVSSSYMIFKKRNLFNEFQILPRKFINFISAIQVCVCVCVNCT